MSLFKKIGKAIGKVAKGVAKVVTKVGGTVLKVAAVGASFIPGIGSVASAALNKVGDVVQKVTDKAKPITTAVSTASKIAQEVLPQNGLTASGAAGSPVAKILGAAGGAALKTAMDEGLIKGTPNPNVAAFKKEFSEEVVQTKSAGNVILYVFGGLSVLGIIFYFIFRKKRK